MSASQNSRPGKTAAPPINYPPPRLREINLAYDDACPIKRSALQRRASFLAPHSHSRGVKTSQLRVPAFRAPRLFEIGTCPLVSGISPRGESCATGGPASVLQKTLETVEPLSWGPVPNLF